MHVLFVDGLHPKALAWDATGVSFEKAVPKIQRIIDGRMPANEIKKFEAAWVTLRRYGNQACDNAAVEGQIIVNDVIGWSRADGKGDVDWTEVLQTVTWIHEAQREIKDIESQEGVPSLSEPSKTPAKMPAKITAEQLLSFFDYDTDMALFINSTIALTARREAAAYPGAVEAGKEVALRLLRNHVSILNEDAFWADFHVRLERNNEMFELP